MKIIEDISITEKHYGSVATLMNKPTRNIRDKSVSKLIKLLEKENVKIDAKKSEKEIINNNKKNYRVPLSVKVNDSTPIRYILIGDNIQIELKNYNNQWGGNPHVAGGSFYTEQGIKGSITFECLSYGEGAIVPKAKEIIEGFYRFPEVNLFDIKKAKKADLKKLGLPKL